MTTMQDLYGNESLKIFLNFFITTPYSYELRYTEFIWGIVTLFVDLIENLKYMKGILGIHCG